METHRETEAREEGCGWLRPGLRPGAPPEPPGGTVAFCGERFAGGQPDATPSTSHCPLAPPQQGEGWLWGLRTHPASWFPGDSQKPARHLQATGGCSTLGAGLPEPLPSLGGGLAPSCPALILGSVTKPRSSPSPHVAPPTRWGWVGRGHNRPLPFCLAPGLGSVLPLTREGPSVTGHSASPLYPGGWQGQRPDLCSPPPGASGAGAGQGLGPVASGWRWTQKPAWGDHTVLWRPWGHAVCWWGRGMARSHRLLVAGCCQAGLTARPVTVATQASADPLFSKNSNFVQGAFEVLLPGVCCQFGSNKLPENLPKESVNGFVCGTQCAEWGSSVGASGSSAPAEVQASPGAVACERPAVRLPQCTGPGSPRCSPSLRSLAEAGQWVGQGTGSCPNTASGVSAASAPPWEAAGNRLVISLGPHSTGRPTARLAWTVAGDGVFCDVCIGCAAARSRLHSTPRPWAPRVVDPAL